MTLSIFILAGNFGCYGDFIMEEEDMFIVDGGGGMKISYF